MRRISPIVVAFIAALILFSTLLAQTILTGTVTKNANLRAGPGTTYAVAGTVTAGQTVKIVGKNAAGTWYHLDSGSQWIAALLVKLTDTVTSTATTPGATATKVAAKQAGTATPVATATKAANKAAPTATHVPAPATATPVATKAAANCDPAYPDFCIPPLPAKSTCKAIGRNNFKVLAPDPQRLDRDGDGIGCEK